MTAPAIPPAIALPGADTSVLDAAVLYAQAELPPIPLYGVRPDGSCDCGHSNCAPRNRGKHPIGSGWQSRATLDLDEVRDRFRGHRGNIGIYLGLTGLVLLDADGEVGLETARTWELPPTLTAQSGSGTGAHYVYRFAAHQDPKQVTDRTKIAPGLDVKARGQFVAAPSRHASGGVYCWTLCVAAAVLPDWLFDRIRRPEAGSVAPHAGDASALERRARAYVERIPEAISGSAGHDQTFAAGRALSGWVAKGLDERAAWAILVDYNGRCQPPWTERELEHKWTDALKAHTVPALPDRPAPGGSHARPALRVVGSDESPPSPPAPPDDDDALLSELLWKDTRSGARKLVAHSENVVRILQRHSAWRGIVGFDAFRSRITVAEAPWDDYSRPVASLGTWTDEDTTRLAGWMRARYHRFGFEPTRSDCEHAVAVVARVHDYNPVRDYLESVSWDGTARLSAWLATYLGAETSEYTRLVGAWWLISAVARIYEPGCKVDTVPILEGRQGLRKSTALRILAGAEWFSDTPIDIGSKDAYSAIQGCWFVELAELQSLVKAEASKAKAFFSSPKDRFRAAYARHARDELRQCIFVGTVNPEEPYLNDPTGARRFWPIPCTRIDLDALSRDRDQLWAEAAHEYREGRFWYPTSDAEVALLAVPQADRTQRDEWETDIAAWAWRLNVQTVTTGQVLRDVLSLEHKDWTKSHQMRVAAILVRIGFERRKMRDGERTYWGFERRRNA